MDLNIFISHITIYFTPHFLLKHICSLYTDTIWFAIRIYNVPIWFEVCYIEIPFHDTDHQIRIPADHFRNLHHFRTFLTTFTHRKKLYTRTPLTINESFFPNTHTPSVKKERAVSKIWRLRLLENRFSDRRKNPSWHTTWRGRTKNVHVICAAPSIKDKHRYFLRRLETVGYRMDGWWEGSVWVSHSCDLLIK